MCWQWIDGILLARFFVLLLLRALGQFLGDRLWFGRSYELAISKFGFGEWVFAIF
jgi:hypothetical protein